MSGTRKLEKFDVERAVAFQSGTRTLEKFEPPQRLSLSIPTPVAELSPAILAAAHVRRSCRKKRW